MNSSPEPARMVKSHQGVSPYSRFINRPIGRAIAMRAHRHGLSANLMTTVSAILTFAGIALLALVPPSVPLGIGVAVLLVLGFAFDSADGQVARLTGTSSLAGEWFDHVVDAGKMVALHGAVLVGWYRFGEQDTSWLALPLAFQVVAVVMFSALTIVSLLKRLQVNSLPATAPSLVRAFGLLPADYGVLCLTFTLWGVDEAFRLGYLVLFLLNTVILGLFLRRWFNELGAGDRRGHL